MKILIYMTIFSALSFLFFGCACFITSQMKSEFKRYGLTDYRKLIGGLQVLGGLGLLLGVLYEPILQIVSSGGLAILMLLGFVVRLKIRDSFIKSFPSLFYALINGYIFYALLLT